MDAPDLFVGLFSSRKAETLDPWTAIYPSLPFSCVPEEPFTFLSQIEVDFVWQEGELGHREHHTLVQGVGILGLEAKVFLAEVLDVGKG